MNRHGISQNPTAEESARLRELWAADDAKARALRLAVENAQLRAKAASPPALDMERLGFRDLLDVAEAVLSKYPPDTIVCSHLHRADIGARTVAAIADLIESARLTGQEGSE